MARNFTSGRWGPRVGEWNRHALEVAREKSDGRTEELIDLFVQVRDALKFLDPAGWSAWYDEHVPDWLGWLNSRPACDVMWARVTELLGGRDPLEGRDEAEVDQFIEIVAGLVHESSVAQTEAVQ